MKAKERHHTQLVLQFRLVDVEIHAVDAFDFQGYVLADDFSDGAWYTHGWLRLTSIPLGSPPHSGKNGTASADPVIGSTGAFYIDELSDTTRRSEAEPR